MTATFYVGDAVKTMNSLPADSVDLVLTSPPFLALRSYLPSDHPDKALEGGSQSTPGAFIDWLIDVVEACDRVLARHGSLCIELGDTYAGSGGAGGDYAENGLRDGQQTYRGSGWHRLGQRATQDDQPPNYRKQGTSTDTGSPKAGTGWPLAKSLSLIPELFRLTLVYGFNPLTGRQTERWRLRNVVRWVRPNPPVGALGDKFRPATSELMVFCKSAKRYFDLDSVREPYAANTMRLYAGGAKSVQPGPKEDGEGGWMGEQKLTHAGAPPLDWWNIPPGGYEGAHYAVFPPELCVKPVKAMCPEKVCRVCGEPSRRITKPSEDYAAALAIVNDGTRNGSNKTNPSRLVKGISRMMKEERAADYETIGFSDCGHDDWRPGLVLDPFAGSGTTGLVATGHGRDCWLIDLDERNYDLALERVGPLVLSKGEVAA